MIFALHVCSDILYVSVSSVYNTFHHMLLLIHFIRIHMKGAREVTNADCG